MEKKNTHLVYGLITGVVLVIVQMVLYLTGLAFKGSAMQYVSQLPFLIGIIMNAMAFSKANDEFVSFGNVFGSGFRMSMIVALIVLAWSVIALFALPGMKEKALDMAREEMMKKSKISEEQVELSLNMMKKYWNVFMTAGVIFSNIFWGAIFSLIGAAVAKKKGPAPMVSDNF
jgi:uncharacterized membrane protein YciS (DUF1049 family)